jgi:diguanylate cyclase
VEFKVSSKVLQLKQPYESLEEGLTALIKCLSLFVPFRLWMVSRVHGSESNVLVAEDKHHDVTPGTVGHWPDSYCSRMVEGLGPCFAPDAQAIPVYAAAPANQTMLIGAYIGQPLVSADGTLLGALCGVDPQPKPEFTSAQEYLVETITRTMSALIAGKLSLDQARQEEAKLRYLAERDALTGLTNRHRWDAALAEEELALKGLGENAMVLMVDLDGLKATNDSRGHACGDQYLVEAARTLRAQLRDIDIVARLGGDEFGAIVRNTSKEEADRLHERVKAAFREAGIQASTGYAMRLSCSTLGAALADADARMYENKSQRKLQRRAGC